MNKEDVKELFKRIKALYPTFSANQYALDEWFNIVAQKGDETFHWGNITFNSIVEEVFLFSCLFTLCRCLTS